MKKIKLLLAAALLLCTAGAWAQTDVTSTYLTNAGFDDCTAETSDVAAKVIVNYSSDGWTKTSSGDFTTIAVTAYGGGVKVGGSTTPSTKKDGSTVAGNTLGIIAGWGDNVILQSGEITLPAGVYTLSVDHYLTSSTSNYGSTSSKFGFVTSGSSYLVSSTTFSASTWTTETVTFTLTESTTGKIQIGLTGLNKSGSGSPAVFYDDVTLTQYSDDDLRDIHGLTSADYANPVVTDFVVNGTFDSNINGWSRTGSFSNNQRQTGKSAPFNGGFYENWNKDPQANKMYQTISNIPNGTYRLDIAAFVNILASPNTSQYVFANSDKTYLTAAGDPPVEYEVYTVVTTNQIEIGLEQTTATANWMAMDNVSLRYYGAGNVINDAKNAAHKLAWEEAKAAAEAAYADAAYTNVTGSEKTALATEIAKDEPSTADDYDTATANLISATSAFTAAKPAYDAYAEISGVAVALSVATGDAPTTAAQASTATNNINVAVYTATTAANMFDVTAVYAPSWSSFGTGSGQHWSGDGSSYADEWRGDTNSSSRNATVTLPEGAYILMSAGRGSDNTVTTMSANGTTVTFASKGDEGRGIDLTGAANFADVADTYTNDNKGRGWEWRYIPVTLGSETAVTITQTITRLSGGAWGSFSDFKILKIGVVATASDYTALNSAISTAEAKTLGFEDGEYAPYNNVAALTALAQAQAIDQGVDNDQDMVQAITTALSGATWTANVGEQNAVFNGNFSSDVEGDWGLTGWTRTNAWGQQRDDVPSDITTAYYNQAGSLKYGDTGVYTMPLKANTVYRLQFRYGAWDQNVTPTVSVLNSTDGMAAMSFAATSTNYKTSMNSVDMVFVTGAAGNYVLTIAGDKNLVVTGVSIKKAASQVLEFADGSVPSYAPGTYPSVKITRALDEGKWATAVYPFAVSGVDDIAVLNSYDAASGALGFTSAAASTANQPFLMRSTAGTSEISLSNVAVASAAATDATADEASLKGVYTSTDITDAEKNYVLSANKIYRVGAAGATINPYRAYIQIAEGAPVKALTFFVDDEATSIDAINGVEAENGLIYNIAGQRLNKVQKGINIVNGKKILK